MNGQRMERCFGLSEAEPFTRRGGGGLSRPGPTRGHFGDRRADPLDTALSSAALRGRPVFRAPQQSGLVRCGGGTKPPVTKHQRYAAQGARRRNAPRRLNGSPKRAPRRETEDTRLRGNAAWSAPRRDGGTRSLETKSWVADVGRTETGVTALSAPTRRGMLSPGQAERPG